LNPPNTPLLVASMRERGCPEGAFLRISKISRKAEIKGVGSLLCVVSTRSQSPQAVEKGRPG
jgi:hypothetical protein